MEKKFKFQVKSGEATKQQLQVLQAKATLRDAKGQKYEALASKYKQEMYAALKHSRSIAARVRKSWAMKLIHEQDMHTQEIQKLKAKMAMRQAKFDQEVVKLHDKVDSSDRVADKASNNAGNMAMREKYIAGLVAEQAVQGRVLRKYMNSMSKIRRKYNGKLSLEWEAEIKKLKKKIQAYKNGRNLTAAKYKILQLEHQIKQIKKRKEIHLEIKRAQNLDIATLLHGAISDAQKGSAKRSGVENRKRVVAAVNAVISSVMANDRGKARAIASKAIHGADMPDQAARESTLQAELKAERARNAALQARLNSKAGIPSPPKVEQKKTQEAVPKQAKNTPDEPYANKAMTKKQRVLWKQLQGLVKMSALNRKNLVAFSEKRGVYKAALPKPPPKANSSLKAHPHYPLLPSSELGAIRKGAFLPAQERDEMVTELKD